MSWHYCKECKETVKFCKHDELNTVQSSNNTGKLMSNLRTILEELKEGFTVCLNCNGKNLVYFEDEGKIFCPTCNGRGKIEFNIFQAEQKIKELMLDEDEIFIFISTGRADKNENKVRGYVESRYVEKIASAIHSAMLKKLED